MKAEVKENIFLGAMVAMSVLFLAYEPPAQPTQPISVNNDTYSGEIVRRAHEFTYKNHEYIIFSTSDFTSKYATSGVVHSPECKCWKNKEK